MGNTLPKHRAREYETIFILHPEAIQSAVDKVTGRCEDVIKKLDGKLLRAENWGKRRLAYPVRKNAKGTYIYLRYLGYQEMVHELERNLRMLDTCIKYLTVKVDQDVDPSARPIGEGDVSFAPRYDNEPDTKEPEVKPETKPVTEPAAESKAEAKVEANADTDAKTEDAAQTVTKAEADEAPAKTEAVAEQSKEASADDAETADKKPADGDTE